MPQQPQNEGLFESFSKNYQTAQWLMQFPALTVMVWLRRDLGFRMVSPIRIFPVTAFLFVISVFAGQSNADARPLGLLVFAVLTFAIGTYQCIRRWMELQRKVRQHTYYLGSSSFGFRWVPDFLKRERRLERFVEPLACGLTGYAVLHLSHALGCWLLLSAVCLRSYEWSVYQRDRNLSLDILDGMLHSQRQSQVVEEFEAKSGWHKHGDANGLPTGLDADVESQITISLKQRKSKTNKNTIDI